MGREWVGPTEIGQLRHMDDLLLLLHIIACKWYQREWHIYILKELLMPH